jgi:hypothetical protein
MKYEKQKFVNGQVLSAECLNHMEEGIKVACDAAPPTCTATDCSKMLSHGENGCEWIDVPKSVSYDTEQELTPEEQARARQNIEAIADGDYVNELFAEHVGVAWNFPDNPDNPDNHRGAYMRYWGYRPDGTDMVQFVGTADGGNVSLGRIAPGVEDTDAVNKKQLDDAIASVGGGGGGSAEGAVLYTEQDLTLEQQAQARENIDTVGRSELEIEPITENSKNLIDMNAVTTGGWHYNGRIETYPANQYIQNYCFTDYMPVVGGEKYVLSVVGTVIDQSILHSFNYYDKDKNFISYTQNKGSAVNSYVFDVPTSAAYLVINSSKYSKFLSSKLQLEKGSVPTEYEDFYVGATVGYYLNGLTVKPSQIEAEAVPKILHLPEKYNLVVGDTFELFWKGIIKCHNVDDYYIEAVCDKGAPFRKRFVYTPIAGDVGNHTLEISVYDNNHTIIASGETILSVNSKATSPANDTVVLYVGDSLANSGYVPDEFHRRLTATNGNPVGDGLSNISFIGTCLSSTNQVPYEGYGGWTFNSYNTENKTDGFVWITATSHGKTDDDQHSVYTDANGKNWKIETVEDGRIKMIRTSSTGTLPASGTLTWVSGGVNTANIVYTASEQAAGNPFWNENTSAVDFLNYVQGQGKNSLDYLYVLLGWNSTSASDDSIRADMNTFVGNVHASFPNCQVVLLGLEIPSFEGLAANYGAKAKWTYYNTMSHVFRLNKLYEEIANATENVSFVQISGQFDTEHNMQTSTRTVNVRNSTTETYQSNGIHPATSGYYQIADACYRDFVHKIQQ